MAWIELHQSLFTHRKTMAVAELLHIPEVHVAGHLISLWTWCLAEAANGVVDSPTTVSRAAQWTGHPEVFAGALVAAGFLDDIAGALAIHDWWDYAHLIDRDVRSPVRRAWEAMSKRLRPIVLARDGYRCRQCGSVQSILEVDHVIAIARGGKNDFANLQTLCRGCNRRKGAR